MAGQLLTNSEILKAIEADEIKVTHFQKDKINLEEKASQIQPSSLDLHVGEIFIPPAEKFDIAKIIAGSKNTPKPRRGTPLAPGHSAIIVTKEDITLAKNISAFGFPPAHLSSSALLMTNPGHVDPGYSGKLSFTVINLGREDIQIDVDMIIVTLLIFKFEKAVEKGYDELTPTPTTTATADERMASKLNALSPDFGNYSARMSAEALDAVKSHSVSLERARLYIPALTGAVTAAIIWLSSLFPTIDALTSDKELNAAKDSLQQELTELSVRISELEEDSGVFEFDSRLDALRKDIESLKADD